MIFLVGRREGEGEEKKKKCAEETPFHACLPNLDGAQTAVSTTALKDSGKCIS